MLKTRGIDGTGRPPEFALRWLFHVQCSSIRGSPGLFVVFLILGDFVGYTAVLFGFLSFLYLYVGISHPRRPPSHSRDTGVFQLSFCYGSCFVGRIPFVRNLFGFLGLFFRFVLLGSISISSSSSIDHLHSCCVMPQFCFSFGRFRNLFHHSSVLSFSRLKTSVARNTRPCFSETRATGHTSFVCHEKRPDQITMVLFC